MIQELLRNCFSFFLYLNYNSDQPTPHPNIDERHCRTAFITLKWFFIFTELEAYILDNLGS